MKTTKTGLDARADLLPLPLTSWPSIRLDDENERSTHPESRVLLRASMIAELLGADTQACSTIPGLAELLRAVSRTNPTTQVSSEVRREVLR